MRLANSRLVELIGWLSLCLLAAAWGPTMETNWRHVWSIFGLFGLVSAAGLEAAQRVRLLQERKRKQGQSLVRYESAMEEIQRQKKTNGEVWRATRRIAEFAAQQDVMIPEFELENQADEQAFANRRFEPRARCSLPVEILINNAEGRYISWTEDDSHRAFIRDISPSGIGLLHNKRIDAHRAVLRVVLENREEISLLACLLWCKPVKDGWFSSGGKVTEVVAARETALDVPKTQPRDVLDEILAASCPEEPQDECIVREDRITTPMSGV